MHYLFVVAILSIVFLSNTVATYFGVENTVTLAYTPFVVYFIARHPDVSKNALTRMMLYVIGFAAFAYVFRLTGLGQDYFKNYLTFLVFPMMVAIDLENEDQYSLALLRKCLLAFFVLECGVAIYEKVTESYIFYDPTLGKTANELKYSTPQESWEFRSFAFFEHPLMNAMVVCVVMSFVLISRMKIKHKLLLFILGYTSLWCFNARGATIVSSMLMIPCLLWNVHQSKMKNRVWIYVAFAMFAALFVWLLMTTSLGGRLLGETKLIDGSAQTRLDVFSFYEYITSVELWFGGPDLYMYVMEKLNAGGVENGVITLILREGMVFTAVILTMLFCIQWRQTTDMGKYTRWWLLAIFYVIGTMNPALASALPWTFWMLSYYAFRPIAK